MKAVVGGGGSGLGLAIAEKLAADGHDLLLWGRNQDRLDAAAARIKAVTGETTAARIKAVTGETTAARIEGVTGETTVARVKAVTVGTMVADASDPAAAERIADAAGDVDICVLNAGGPPPAPADRTDPDTWRAALQLLTVTPIDLATRLLPGMRERGFGRIVAVLSSGVREPLPELSYSNAGRAALATWLKTVGRVVAKDGVTVNGVVPGRIDTERVARLDRGAADRTGKSVAEIKAASISGIPAGRYGRPEEFAAVVGFLASPAASYVTASLLSCDGGMMRSLT